MMQLTQAMAVQIQDEISSERALASASKMSSVNETRQDAERD